MTPRKILVVDDERIVAEDISECLLGMGCTVVGVAISGAEAIEKAERFRPDLILMDVCLQGEMDGIQAASIVRERLEIPSVFLTAYSDPGVLCRAKAAEPAGYIVKPFEEASLRSTVEIALHKVDMERALRQNHDWFATILMSIGDGVIVTDEYGSVKMMNPVAEHLTGWETRQVVGHPVDRIFPVYDAATGQPQPNPALRALQEGQVCLLPGDCVLLRADGTALAIDDSGAPIRNRKGAITGAVLIFRDATEQRNAAQQLRSYQQHLEQLVEERTAEILSTNKKLVAEIEERKRVELALARRAELEALVSSVSGEFLTLSPADCGRGIDSALARLGHALQPDGACVFLLDDIRAYLTCSHEWTLNPAWARRQHLPAVPCPPTPPAPGGNAREVMVYPFLDHAPPPARAELLVRLATLRQTPSFVLVPIVDQDQLMGFLSVESIQLREWDAAELAVLGIISDTMASALHRARVERDKRRLQDQLTRSQRMEAVGRLSGGIAHDFNNTLLPIIGYADMLLSRLPADDETVNELSEIRRAAQHAATLTRQLLAFSKKQVVNKVNFDLNAEIASMRRLLQRIIGEDISLTTSLTPDLPPILADIGQMEQVVMNLLVNARDAMPNGGAVAISTEKVHVPTQANIALLNGKEPAGDFIRLTVSDTGVGIPAENRDRIFDPFFTTKGAEGTGTGLGLSVIFSIVEQHGGGIEVDSEVGRGTTFRLYLPASLGKTAPVHSENCLPQAGTLTRGAGERILLVEDEEAVNRFVSQALRQHGYNVLAASSVTEARQIFSNERGQFDMVFSDAILPDGNGVDLLSNVLGQRPQLRALLSSGYTDKHALLALAAEREIAFLQKPYTLPELLRTVKEVLHGEKHAVLN